ncbi:MAG: hypothetical protein FWE45_02610 [Firmicutes bacterium]|nr:hypothetical protein [Bacillota bacterium]
MKEIEVVEQSDVEFKMDNGDGLENPCPSVQDEDSTNIYGNFANADELFKAYRNLHAEFTRKSQELRKLETVNDKSETIMDTTKTCDVNDEKVENPLIVTRSVDDVIRDYLFGIKQGKVPPIVIGTATNATTSVDGIRTMTESDKLAKTFFATTK